MRFLYPLLPPHEVTPECGFKMHLSSCLTMFYTYPIQFTLDLVVKLHLRYCFLVILVVVNYVVVDIVVVDVVSAVIVVVLW